MPEWVAHTSYNSLGKTCARVLQQGDGDEPGVHDEVRHNVHLHPVTKLFSYLRHVNRLYQKSLLRAARPDVPVTLQHCHTQIRELSTEQEPVKECALSSQATSDAPQLIVTQLCLRTRLEQPGPAECTRQASQAGQHQAQRGVAGQDLQALARAEDRGVGIEVAGGALVPSSTAC